MITPVFPVTITNNKEVFENLDKYIVWKAGLEGKKCELILRKRRNQRSIRQNAAYWGIVIPILMVRTGYTKKQMHFALKKEFASYVDPITGLTVVESTAKMSTVRFNKYYEDIQHWASDFLNCNIPSPNECDFYSSGVGQTEAMG